MAKTPKRIHQKGRRKCMFCGGFRISKEHVFPDWLKKNFPPDQSTTHTLSTITWPKDIITKSPKIGRRTRPGHAASTKVRVVCEICNNGWMSALEERTKPILIPLLKGERSNLPPQTQFILATWAAKTSMTAEHLRPRVDGIAQEDRTWLMNNHIPPTNWFVWIAAYNDTTWRELAIYQNRGMLQLSPIPRPGENQFYVQSTTFGVGHILFLTVSSSLPQIGDKFAGREVDGLLQIWPPQPRSILWPPARILGDPQANAIANVLGLTRVFDHSLDPGADWTFTF